MSRPRRLAGPLVLAVLTLFASAGAASAAERIVYVCGEQLCATDPDRGGTERITSGEGGWRNPSLSTDGTTLAAQRGSDVLVGAGDRAPATRWTGSRSINDVTLSGDGTAVAESHSYVENVFGCPLTGGCLQLVDRSAAGWSQGVAGEGNTRGYRGGGGVGSLGARGLLTSFYSIGDDTHTVCVIAEPATPGTDRAPCAATASDGRTLTAPAGSRDGKRFAVVRIDGQAPTIVLHDAVTGAALRELGQGTNPSFSPDGSRIVFQRPDGGLATVRTSGGGVRSLGRKGIEPTWSVRPGAGTASTALRYRGGRIPVRVTCEGSATCSGTVRLRKGSTTIGSRAYRVRAGRRATVSVRPTARGRRSLARARRHTVTVQLRPRSGRVVSDRLTLRR